MPEEYYPEPDDQMPPEGEVEDESTETEEDSEQTGSSALLPKSVLGGKTFEPGDEVVLKVKKVYDDEVEVEYAPEKPKMDDSEMNVDNEIDMMASKGS